MNLGAKVVKYRHIIFIVSLLLLIPSLIGYKTTSCLLYTSDAADD